MSGSENLMDLVKNYDTANNVPPVVTKEPEIKDEKPAQEPEKKKMKKAEKPKEVFDYNILTLNQWFIKYRDAIKEDIQNVKMINISGVKGIDVSKTMVFSVLQKIVETEEKRNILSFNDCHYRVCLDMKPTNLGVFKNGFMFSYEKNPEDNFILKSYSISSKLVLVHGVEVNGLYIPYHSCLYLKDSGGCKKHTIPDEKIEEIKNLFDTPLDYEKLVVLYKQSEKFQDSLKTTGDAIKWLCDRQAGVVDVNHHTEIDGVIMDLLKK